VEGERGGERSDVGGEVRSEVGGEVRSDVGGEVRSDVGGGVRIGEEVVEEEEDVGQSSG